MEGLMYQDAYNEIMKTFEKNEVFIAETKQSQQPEVRYFIYNDNQTKGNVTEKLCQI